MWLMVMFDLPVLTKENRRDYRHFVEHLEDDGFSRVQYSIYVRPCATDENTQAHFDRVIGWLPPAGEVRMLKFTDKQWGRMVLFREASQQGIERMPEQFTFFDEDDEPAASGAASQELRHRTQIAYTEVTPSGQAFVAESRADLVPPPKSEPPEGASRTTENVVAGVMINLTQRAERRKGKRTPKPKIENPRLDFTDF